MKTKDETEFYLFPSAKESFRLETDSDLDQTVLNLTRLLLL